MRALVLLYAVVPCSCAIHARDLLPISGAYSWEIQSADAGIVLKQPIAIIRDDTQAAVIYLPDSSGLPPACARNASIADCERVLGGLLLGRILSASNGNLYSRNNELVIQEPLIAGQSFNVYNDANCKLQKTIQSVTADEVIIRNSRICSGLSFDRGMEVWRRGHGMVQLVTEDGTSVSVRHEAK
jgi:hypothetical protein